MIKTVATTPYTDQKMGTGGLRKKTKVMMQPNYFENFIQTVFNTIGGVEGKTYVVGGDGRYYNDVAIQKFIKMAAANGVAKLIIGQNGFMSTPAGSNVLLKNKTNGAFIFSASHNPGGIDNDFGVKYSDETPAVRFRHRLPMPSTETLKPSANTRFSKRPTSTLAKSAFRNWRT